MQLKKYNHFVHSHLTEEQTDLRFELFDWLKSKNLSVNTSVSLLELTATEIKKAAREQALNQ